MFFSTQNKSPVSKINNSSVAHRIQNQFTAPILFQQQKDSNDCIQMKSIVPTSSLIISNNQRPQPGEEEENVCCWSKGETLAERFCLDSSLHGLKYIGQPRRSACEKIFWLGAFILSGIGCVFIILALWNKYWSSPVVTVFQPTETPINLIPFPAVTICNVNNVRKSRANQYIERSKEPNLSYSERLQAYADLYDLNHICEASTTFAQRFNVSARSLLDTSSIDKVVELRNELPPSDPTQVLRKATQNCSELILLCLWLDEIQDCNTFFHGVETDYGFCCTFNVVPLTLLLKYRNDSSDNPQVVEDWAESTQVTSNNILLPAIEMENNFVGNRLPKYPHRQVYHGRSSGLSVLLDPDLDEYFCRNTDADGFVIRTSHPLDFPRVRDHGIAVRPNSETFMSIKPDLTIADPSIFSFNVNKRQCYLAGEKTLKYYSYYTAFNCVDECIANHTFEACTCVQYYMPRANDQPLCSPDQFDCTERVRKDIVQKGLLKECDKCLPNCNDVSYQVETTFLDMHDEVFLKENFPGLNRSLNGRNMTIVHLYMGVESSYPRLRKELYSVIDLISSTGGLLSLCLGFSMLSVLEICYFSTIRVCLRSYRKFRRSKSAPFVASPFLLRQCHSRLLPEAWTTRESMKNSLNTHKNNTTTNNISIQTSVHPAPNLYDYNT